MGANGNLTAVVLFADAGGLLLGTSLAGFRHLAAAEWEHNCCDTLRLNQAKGYPLIDEDVRIVEGDAVPVELARVVAASVACALREDTARKQMDALLASELAEAVSHEAALV